MPIPKIKGIETELSIVKKNGHYFAPANIFDLERMVDAIRRYFGLSVGSREESLREIENAERLDDFHPLRARAARWLRQRPSSLLAVHHNLLPNGARLYIDGPHLEYSTPECLSARTLVAADRAGEAIVSVARRAINEQFAQGEELIVRKDNTDRNGISYGCHENYLVSRPAFGKMMDPAGLEVGYLASFLVCRLIFTGSGKMGVESDGERLAEHNAVYQISQRADFVKVLLGGCTVLNRSLVNTRDEPMADETRFARLHVIVGDANLSEVANYMKVGITSIVLKMLEDEFLQGDIIIGDPVNGIKLVSQNLDCKSPVLETLEGRKLSSLNFNEEFFRMAKAYFSNVCEPSPEENDLLRLWEETISDFQGGNEARLASRFDWKIKQRILNDFLEAHGVSWQDIDKAEIRNGRRRYKVVDQLRSKDMLYHDLDKERGLYWAYKEDGEVEQLVDSSDAGHLVKNPPPECRSYFRGRCIGKFSEDIETVDWGSIYFFGKNAANSGRNFHISLASSGVGIELLNPLWGGEKDVKEIIDGAADPRDLLKELQETEMRQSNAG